MELALEDFSAWCVLRSPTSFCLSILPVDNLPETDKNNNRVCVDVNAVLTGVIEAEPIVWRLSPNPANDFITISFENDHVADYHGVILNGRGDFVDRFKLQAGKHEIGLMDYTPGIYFLSIMSNQGVHVSKKFSVIH